MIGESQTYPSFGTLLINTYVNGQKSLILIKSLISTIRDIDWCTRCTSVCEGKSECFSNVLCLQQHVFQLDLQGEFLLVVIGSPLLLFTLPSLFLISFAFQLFSHSFCSNRDLFLASPSSTVFPSWLYHYNLLDWPL